MHVYTLFLMCAHTHIYTCVHIYSYIQSSIYTCVLSHRHIHTHTQAWYNYFCSYGKKQSQTISVQAAKPAYIFTVKLIQYCTSIFNMTFRLIHCTFSKFTVLITRFKCSDHLLSWLTQVQYNNIL